jgi:cobalamin synthase
MPTGIVLAMWVAWAVVAVVTLILYAYRTSLTRDEEGQIFLDEAFEHEKAHQGLIVSKLNRIQPLVSASLIATAVMTCILVAYYLYMAYESLWG